MAGVDVKLGVSGLDTFKKNLNDAKAAVNAWDAALGLNKETLKNVGDQEAYVVTQAYLLTQQIEAQEKVVGTLQQALTNMNMNGVDQSSAAFQKMKEESYKAQSKLMDMQTELKGIQEGGSGAAEGLGKTDKAVGDINKNVAWQNVSKGIGDIAKNLERGAKAAINFGKKVLASVKDATEWADDLKTMSLQTGFSVEELQKMDKVAEIVDTDVDAIVNAQKKMRKAATTEGGIKTLEETLGIKLSGQSPEDLFWEIGDALVHMGDEFDKEAAAQKLFGASWRNLLPLFTLGRQGYEDLLDSQTVLTEDQVEKLAKADDAIKQMEQEVEQLKRQFWSENADNITKLMTWLIENSDKVKSALEVIAGGFALLKLGEMATNMASFINGLKTLGLTGGGGGGGGTPTVAPTTAPASGAASGTGIKGWFGNIMNNMVQGMGINFVLNEVKQLKDQFNKEMEEINKLKEENEWSENDQNYYMLTGKKPDINDKNYQDWLEMVVNGNTKSESGKREEPNFDQLTLNESKMLSKEFAQAWMDWIYNDAQNDELDKLSGMMTWEEFEAFDKSMQDILNGVNHYNEEDINAFYNPIMRALELIEQNSGGTKNTSGDIDMTGAMNNIAAAAKSGIESANITVVITQDALDGVSRNTGKSLGDRLRSFFPI